jgi:phosphatidylinositol alpha-1,6-mannosyltransferase
MAEDLAVADRVIFAGFIAEEDLAEFYNYCDVFALVSERGVGMGEGLPLVLLEASACGKPIITGNADGSVDAVDHGVNGYSLDPYNIDAIAGAIRELVSNAELRKRMGQAGTQRVMAKNSYEVFRSCVANFAAGFQAGA